MEKLDPSVAEQIAQAAIATKREEAGRQYAAAYDAQYTGRDLPVALRLYMKVVASHPDTQEAGYSCTQVHNIVNAVVPRQEILDAEAELAIAHLEHEGSLDARRIPVTALASEVSNAARYARSIKRETGVMLAIGLVETKGLIGLVAATDAMLKAADVQVVKRIGIGGGLVTAIVNGDVASVSAAVEVGARVAKQVGAPVSSQVIANPAKGMVEAFLA